MRKSRGGGVEGGEMEESRKSRDGIENKIDFFVECEVRLDYPNGASWEVKPRLDEEARHGGRLLMTQGWLGCWEATDTMVFELVNARTDLCIG
ncbi:unnamed protein product [Prunus armeniaca]|uniref:Uncharacterized protein n=1 Tax=Prunus armeniaca TaxID=36596 RepID=A0A6J5U8N7_PRUAR|nr:unnamed protein product [Prunus armeniaca]